MISVISINIVLGGLGFLVLTELANIQIKKNKSLFKQFTMHTKIVLVTTAILIAAGALLFIFLEWNNIINEMSPGRKILVSIFQSLTCRTAGFNTVDIGALRHSTLSVMMLLMFIGGSPGSMAGGIKTTTVAVISGIVISKIRRQKQIVFWNRAVNEEVINRSMLLVILCFIFIYSSTIILLSIQSFDMDNSFLKVMFEVISAFATVGLSTGITSQFPDVSKLLLSAVMFIGRVGVFAIITTLTARKGIADIEIADENIMVG